MTALTANPHSDPQAQVPTSMNLPIAVWMMRSFRAEVPEEMLEATRFVTSQGLFLAKVCAAAVVISLPVLSAGFAA